MLVNHVSYQEKTNYMSFTVHKTQDQQMTFNERIVKVEYSKFLYVLIDPRLSWVGHIQFVLTRKFLNVSD